MAKALRLIVAVVVREVLLLFGAVVPGQLENTLAVGLALSLLGQASDAGVGEEVEVEAVGLVVVLADEAHAKHVLVELERLLNVLDAEHGVVLFDPVSMIAMSLRGGNQAYHAVGGNISLLDLGSLLEWLLANDLAPVTIGVEDKGNVPHATVRQLLLERVTAILDALAGGLEVVNADAGVTETAVRLLVAVGDGEVGVVLSAVVVGELRCRLMVRFTSKC